MHFHMYMGHEAIKMWLDVWALKLLKNKLHVCVFLPLTFFFFIKKCMELQWSNFSWISIVHEKTICGAYILC